MDINDRIYDKSIDRLRSDERVSRLEINKVIDYCLKGSKLNSILDVGTGSGLFAEAFASKGIIVSGIDLNEKMIDEAKIYLPESEFKVGVAEAIPYDKDSFDASFYGLVFHEVSDYKKALSEAYRVSHFYTFLLEWKFKVEEFGPPIEHRLKSEFIKNLSNESGYKKFTEIPLANLVLYRLDKN